MLLTRQQFVELYYPMAQKVTKGTGIFPETLLAIAIVESQAQVNGVFYPAQSVLVKRANNYFGIKSYPKWTGKTIQVNTPNDADKVSTFVVYNSTEDSFKGFVRFLKENPRYANSGVFTAGSFPDQIIKIARAGYAENTNYANVIVNVANSISSMAKDLKQTSEPVLKVLASLGAILLIINKLTNE
jgi:flagellum-specific peptidoglycan hydrolase FlgJ